MPKFFGGVRWALGTRALGGVLESSGPDAGDGRISKPMRCHAVHRPMRLGPPLRKENPLCLASLTLTTDGRALAYHGLQGGRYASRQKSMHMDGGFSLQRPTRRPLCEHAEGHAHGWGALAYSGAPSCEHAEEHAEHDSLAVSVAAQFPTSPRRTPQLWERCGPDFAMKPMMKGSQNAAVGASCPNPSRHRVEIIRADPGASQPQRRRRRRRR